ncbi:MAG: flagellar motor protein MotB [Betaproteobacteria bacterium]|jgi:chemotaxis protein MotB|nr:flagellar motor protein MotB [Betaproteobacteria bacterium]
MADESQRPIVIKRIKKTAGGHHGGAWKIAYADFVTAMMAFFLLMWLLGSTTKGDLKGIADFFNTPLKVALAGGIGSGDSSHVIKGGGKDLTRSEGQIMDGELQSDRRIINIKAAQAELERREEIKMAQLKVRIEHLIESNPALRQFREQLLVDITPEGLRVQIVDTRNRPMFASGRAELQPYARDILYEIGRALNGVENRISIAGHTDATPYASGERGYSNWELSADRANASRRVLIQGGMDEGRLVRVVGMAAAVPLDRKDPLNPLNRRISLIVMNRQAEEAVNRSGGSVELAPPNHVDIPRIVNGNS